MATSSLYLPKELLHELDEAAAQENVSRNRLIRIACEKYLQRSKQTWPDDFFEALSKDDERVLQESKNTFSEELMGWRKNRTKAPF